MRPRLPLRGEGREWPGQLSRRLGIDLAGRVAPDGAIKVSIKVGDKGASGTGHLSGRTGAGVWRGIGASGSCAGRWEAELE